MKRTLATLLLLVACTQPGVFVEDGYRWEHNPNAEYCPREPPDWTQLDPVFVASICGDHMLGCNIMNTCTIVSMYNIDDAKKVFVLGTNQSHFDHEYLMHMLRQLRHPL